MFELCLAFAMKLIDDLLIEFPIWLDMLLLAPVAEVTILRPALAAETALCFVLSDCIWERSCLSRCLCICFSNSIFALL